MGVLALRKGRRSDSAWGPRAARDVRRGEATVKAIELLHETVASRIPEFVESTSYSLRPYAKSSQYGLLLGGTWTDFTAMLRPSVKSYV
jgi:hypothetical protein